MNYGEYRTYDLIGSATDGTTDGHIWSNGTSDHTTEYHVLSYDREKQLLDEIAISNQAAQHAISKANALLKELDILRKHINPISRRYLLKKPRI